MAGGTVLGGRFGGTLFMGSCYARLRWTVRHPLAWMLTVFSGATVGLLLVSDPPPPTDLDLALTQERSGLHARLSQAGVHYGWCGGVIDAVMLWPEPCDWGKGAMVSAR